MTSGTKTKYQIHIPVQCCVNVFVNITARMCPIDCYQS